MSYSLRPMNEQTENSGWIGPQDALGELQRRTAMLDAIGYAATRIVTSGDWRPGIQELLDRLGHATGVSRVSLFEIHHDARRAAGRELPLRLGRAGPAVDERRPALSEHAAGRCGRASSTTGLERRQRGEVVQATAARSHRLQPPGLRGDLDARPSSRYPSCCAAAAGASWPSTTAIRARLDARSRSTS